MATPLEIVKDVYDRFGRGDFEGFLGLCDEEIEWVVNGPASLEKCRAYRGRSGVREFLALLGAWEFRSFSPREFFEDGATVVVLGEETGAVRASGTAFENRWAHLFDVRDGRIVRFREFLCHWPEPERSPETSWGPVG